MNSQLGRGFATQYFFEYPEINNSFLIDCFGHIDHGWFFLTGSSFSNQVMSVDQFSTQMHDPRGSEISTRPMDPLKQHIRISSMRHLWLFYPYPLFLFVTLNYRQIGPQHQHGLTITCITIVDFTSL